MMDVTEVMAGLIVAAWAVACGFIWAMCRAEGRTPPGS